MPIVSATLVTSVSRNCFLTLPSKLKDSFKENKDGIVVVKVEWEDRWAYLSGKMSIVHEMVPRMRVKGYMSRVQIAEPLSSIRMTLDATFANILGIEPGTEAAVSQESVDVPHCTSVDLSVAAEDEEILALHKPALERSLLDRIRVIYPGQRFPIWYNSFRSHIIVQVSHTQPECAQDACALLVDSTDVNILPTTTAYPHVGTLSTSAPPSAYSTVDEDDRGSATTDSSDGGGGGGTGKSKSRFTFWDYFYNGLKAEPSAIDQYIAPTEPETPVHPFTSILSYLIPSSDSNGGQVRSKSVMSTLEKKVIPSDNQGTFARKHSKQPSLPVNLEDYSQRPHINTPPLSLDLRVQPLPGAITSTADNGGSGGHHSCKLCLEDSLPGDLTAVVHPDTLPPVYHGLVTRSRASAGLAYYVVLSLVPLPPVEVEDEGAGPEAEEGKRAGQNGQNSAATATNDSRSVVVRLCLQKTLHPLPPDDGEGDFLTESSVDSDLEELPLRGFSHHADSRPFKRMSSSAMFSECTCIRPGHIVLSAAVRGQLGAGLYSRVRVVGAAERDLSTCGRISVVPLLPTTRVREARRCFSAWLREEASTQTMDDVPVTENMIVLLDLEKGAQAKIPCRLKVEWKKGPLVVRSEVPRFCLLSRSDLEKMPVHGEVPKPALSSEAVKAYWSSPADLDPPLATRKLKPLAALRDTLLQGVSFLRNAFCGHINSQQLGGVRSQGDGLLICGVGENYSSGCGRTSLARQLCQSVMGHPSFVHCVELEGTQLKNRRGVSVHKVLKGAILEAEHKQPSILFIDNLDEFCMAPPPLEYDPTGDGPLSIRASEYLIDMLSAARFRGATITLVAVSHSKAALNPALTRVKGGSQLFGRVIELTPPSLTDRIDILDTCLANRLAFCNCSSVEKREVARRTEGYNIDDIVRLIDRAIYSAEYKALGKMRGHSPGSPLRHANSEGHPKMSPSVVRHDASERERGDGSSKPKSRVDGGRNSESFNRVGSPVDSDGESGEDISSSPTGEETLNSSGYRSRLSHETRGDSVATMVDSNSTKTQITMEHFNDAFKGFVPVALRGVSLNKSTVGDFSRVGGMTEAKRVLTELILWPSKYPKLFGALPLNQQCGILLYGPSGTGKTLLALSVAKQFQVNFISVKGPELLNKFIGASEQKVRDVFLQAQMAQPCVLFFDEFESLAPRRGHDNTGVTDRVVNQFLTQLDGIERLKGVFVIAASSRPDLIDPALLRPGRINKKIFCAPPDKDEMVAILKSLVDQSVNIAPEVLSNLDKVVDHCEKFTGADLKALLSNAQLVLAHELYDRSITPEVGRFVPPRSISEGSPEEEEELEEEGEVNAMRGSPRKSAKKSTAIPEQVEKEDGDDDDDDDDDDDEGLVGDMTEEFEDCLDVVSFQPTKQRHMHLKSPVRKLGPRLPKVNTNTPSSTKPKKEPATMPRKSKSGPSPQDSTKRNLFLEFGCVGQGREISSPSPVPTHRPDSLARSISEPVMRNSIAGKMRRGTPVHGFCSPGGATTVVDADIRGAAVTAKLNSVRAKPKPLPLKVTKRHSLTPQFTGRVDTPGFSMPPLATAAGHVRPGEEDGEAPPPCLQWRHFMSALETTTPSLSDEDRRRATIVRAKLEGKVQESVHNYIRQRTSHS